MCEKTEYLMLFTHKGMVALYYVKPPASRMAVGVLVDSSEPVAATGA